MKQSEACRFYPGTRSGITPALTDSALIMSFLARILKPGTSRPALVMVLLAVLPPFASAAGNDWMAGIDGGAKPSRITIPGTHDSGARIEPFFPAGAAKTQDFPIAEQLDFGVRFLDIRCRHISDTFAIHHGAIFREMFFGEVLNHGSGYSVDVANGVGSTAVTPTLAGLNFGSVEVRVNGGAYSPVSCPRVKLAR